MLIGNDPHIFEDVAILPLAGVLLYLLVRYVKARKLVAVQQAQPVTRSEVTLVRAGKAPRGSIVGVVFGDGRTEIAARHCAACADSEQVFPGEILEHGVGAGGVKAAS